MSVKMFAYGVLLGLVSALAHGSPCKDLSGVWQNNLGSKMSIVHLPDNPYKFSGQYNTSVDVEEGVPRISSPIAGLVNPVEGGSLVSFTVLWNNGTSIATWVGQCIVCDGKETIYTTWTLRSLKDPVDKWMTTQINQDTFWKLDGEQPELAPTIGAVGMNPAILGLWSSITGDSLEFTFAAQTGKLEGNHLTPMNLTPQAEEDFVTPVALFGSTSAFTLNRYYNYTAFGFSAAGPTLMKGWTGHIYPSWGSILETSWIAHGFSDSCNNPRRYVHYGMDNYTQPIWVSE